MVFAVVFAGGLALGCLTGRWWIMLAPAAFGFWIFSTTDVDEVPHWFLGFAYGAAGVLGVLVGLILRRQVARGHA